MDEFHLLRPAWLLALIPIVALVWLRRRRRAQADAMGGLIAPHLLEHLMVGSASESKIGPAQLALLVAVVLSVALAGPTWKREPPPFAEDRAALVVAIDVSASMNGMDVAPTRLERAKQKVRDLLAQRSGARTGLVAYAGSAHLVLPLTEDRTIVETYLESLETELMPKQGKRPDLAVAAARELLDRQKTPGSILLLTDGVPSDVRDGIDRNVLLLGIGTARGGPLRTDKSKAAPPLAVDESGARITTLTADDSDVRQIVSRAETSIIDVPSAGEGRRWKDAGYYLVFPVLLLVVFWFRRGWIVRWAYGLLPVMFLGCSSDAWWTADQQGQERFDQGDYAAAAELFEDPAHRGAALFRAGEFEQAVTAYALAGEHYNRGNALFMLGKYDDAMEAYDAALAVDPLDDAAQFNRELARQQKAKMTFSDEDRGEGTKVGADKIVFDKKKGAQGTDTVVRGMPGPQTAELWMRQVQTTPADFLRLKFQFQEAK